MDIVIILIIVLVSMTLHEAVHGFAAYYLGDTTAKDLGRLSLNPLKHIDLFLTILLPIFLAINHLPIFGGAKPVPLNPSRLRGGEWGMALVAFAGPLTNFLIAFIAFGVFAMTGAQQGTTVGHIALIAVLVNLGFFTFNMIPIPPLDGSRVLYALAPDFMRRGMEAFERYGLIAVLLIVLVASPLIGSFISGAVSVILALFALIFGLT